MNISDQLRSFFGEIRPTQPRLLELKPGQVVRGVILQLLDQSEALVHIGGNMIKARLEAELKPGEVTLLQVQPESTGDKIVLKSVSGNGMHISDEAIKSLLNSLGLRNDAVHRQLVLHMQNYGVPITAEHMGQLAEALKSLPMKGNGEGWVQSAVFALQRNLALTEGTIAAVRQAMFGPPLVQSVERMVAMLSAETNMTLSPKAEQLRTQLMQTLSAYISNSRSLFPLPPSTDLAPNPVQLGHTLDDSSQIAVQRGRVTAEWLPTDVAPGRAVAGSAPTDVSPGRPVVGSTSVEASSGRPVAGFSSTDVPQGRAVAGSSLTDVPSGRPVAGLSPTEVPLDRPVAGSAPTDVSPGRPVVGSMSADASSGRTIAGFPSTEVPLGRPVTGLSSTDVAPSPPSANTLQTQSQSTGQTSENPLLEWFKLAGFDYEKVIAKSMNLYNQNQVETTKAHWIQNVKSLLMQWATMSDEAASVTKDLAQQIIQQITGQQLLLTADRTTPFTQITLFVPFQDEDGGQSAAIHIQARRGKRGIIEVENCRLLFDLQLGTLGNTLVDVHIVDRIISLQIHNDHPLLNQVLNVIRDEAVEAFQLHGYKFLSLKSVPYPDKKDKIDHHFMQNSSRSSASYSPKSYKGVDIKV